MPVDFLNCGQNLRGMIVGMWNTISNGLASSAAQFASAASGLIRSVTPATTSPPPSQPAPAGTPTAPAPSSPSSPAASGATAVAAQGSDPSSWMVQILQAQSAYQANISVAKTADAMAQQAINMVS